MSGWAALIPMAFWKRLQRQLVGGSGGPSPKDLALIAASGLFDRDWYLAQYPDVRASGSDPLAHFVSNGGREGRDPGPKFSTRAYVARYREVVESGVNPLVHYLRTGQSEGHRIEPSDRAEKAPDENVPLLVKSDLFDAKWYRMQYPDITTAGVDPAAHYLASGANEGRDPGPHFSTAWYLAEHKDIDDANQTVTVTSDKSSMAQTGRNILIGAAIAAAVAAGAGGTYIYRKRHQIDDADDMME